MKNEFIEYKKFKDMVNRVRVAKTLSDQEKIDYFRFFYDINSTVYYTPSETEKVFYDDNGNVPDTLHYGNSIKDLDLYSLGKHHFIFFNKGLFHKSKPTKINRHYFVGKRNDIPYGKAQSKLYYQSKNGLPQKILNI